MKVIMMTVVSMLIAINAYAGTVSKEGNAWVYNGNIEMGDAEKFKAIPEGSTVHMISIGGYAMEGFRIGSVLKKRNLSVITFSQKRFRCESACAIAAMYAPRVNGTLYFHKAYFSNVVRAMHQLNGHSDAALDAHLYKTNMVVANQMKINGVSDRDISKFWATTPSTFVKVKM